MKKLKKPFIIIISIVMLITGYTLIDKYRSQKEYEAKPNIYEIPKTSSTYTNGDCTTYKRHYIIKEYPDELDDLKELIQDFIEENNIINSMRESTSTKKISISLDFYRISEFLPFDFEENPGFGGDVIDDRRDDCIAYLRLYGSEFYYVIRTRTPNNKHGYSDVIEETRYYEEITN